MLTLSCALAQTHEHRLPRLRLHRGSGARPLPLRPTANENLQSDPLCAGPLPCMSRSRETEGVPRDQLPATSKHPVVDFDQPAVDAAGRATTGGASWSPLWDAAAHEYGGLAAFLALTLVFAKLTVDYGWFALGPLLVFATLTVAHLTGILLYNRRVAHGEPTIWRRMDIGWLLTTRSVGGATEYKFPLRSNLLALLMGTLTAPALYFVVGTILLLTMAPCEPGGDASADPFSEGALACALEMGGQALLSLFVLWCDPPTLLHPTQAHPVRRTPSDPPHTAAAPSGASPSCGGACRPGTCNDETLDCTAAAPW